MSTEPVPIIATSPTQIQLTPDQQSAFFRAVNGALPSTNGSNLASFLPGNAIAIPAFALGNALPPNISPDQFIVAVPVAQSSTVFSSQESINPLAPPPAASIVPPAFRALCDSLLLHYQHSDQELLHLRAPRIPGTPDTFTSLEWTYLCCSLCLKFALDLTPTPFLKLVMLWLLFVI